MCVALDNTDTLSQQMTLCSGIENNFWNTTIIFLKVLIGECLSCEGVSDIVLYFAQEFFSATFLASALVV